MTEGRGETSDADHEGTESPLAKRDTQSPATGESHRRSLNSIEPPWYGPVCPVVWEGRGREAPPYPHLCPKLRTPPAMAVTPVISPAACMQRQAPRVIIRPSQIHSPSPKAQVEGSKRMRTLARQVGRFAASLIALLASLVPVSTNRAAAAEGDPAVLALMQQINQQLTARGLNI